MVSSRMQKALGKNPCRGLYISAHDADQPVRLWVTHVTRNRDYGMTLETVCVGQTRGHGSVVLQKLRRAEYSGKWRSQGEDLFSDPVPFVAAAVKRASPGRGLHYLGTCQSIRNAILSHMPN